MNYTITLSDNDLMFMEEATGDVVVSCEKLPQNITADDQITIHYTQDKENIQHIYTVLDIDSNNNVVTLKWDKQEEQELLTEAPIVKLSDADINNPDTVTLKNIAKAAKEAEDAQIAKDEFDAKTAELRAKNEPVVETMANDLDKYEQVEHILDKAFDKLVPQQGAAQTVAGEHLRALMRILYRDANDGDKFFEGYGIETCGGSAEYLYDNGFSTQIEDIMDNAYYLSDNDDKYTEELLKLTRVVLQSIVENPELAWTPNDTDSREYSVNYIEENQPRYEYSFLPSDSVEDLLDSAVVTAWQVKDYVEQQLEYDSAFSGAEVARPWSTYSAEVTVENLTKDGYDALEHMITSVGDRFWTDFLADYAVEDEPEDDPDLDDEV